ncbi:sigma-70 family RNA polymerase sigma factor [Macrococcus armenti]|uniref:sigma-70 family RNA polymerase sigma factor n=1 Tax=Macrococcus armenti TaxID=2875764 RepID=UPI001CCC211C|nr:sigma-70 family RNA polymerase sigma factor [Macrococcus armenti]UBH18452.1 sigma-70 family RNA polymerase sigma factor [Macrococcus armenti]
MLRKEFAVNFEEVLQNNERVIHYFIHKYRLTYMHDEMYQLALIKLWEIYENYDPALTNNMQQFIFTKLNFFFIDEIRKLKRNLDRYAPMECITYESYTDETLVDYTQFFHMLCDHEYEWLMLTIQGYQQKEIAHMMNKSVSTLKNYRKSCQKKLQKLK